MKPAGEQGQQDLKENRATEAGRGTAARKAIDEGAGGRGALQRKPLVDSLNKLSNTGDSAIHQGRSEDMLHQECSCGFSMKT